MTFGNFVLMWGANILTQMGGHTQWGLVHVSGAAESLKKCGGMCDHLGFLWGYTTIRSRYMQRTAFFCDQ